MAQIYGNSDEEQWQLFQFRKKYGIEFHFSYCPKCGRILDERKHYHWSADHSITTGYTLYSTCIFCLWIDIYHDVE